MTKKDKQLFENAIAKLEQGVTNFSCTALRVARAEELSESSLLKHGYSPILYQSIKDYQNMFRDPGSGSYWVDYQTAKDGFNKEDRMQLRVLLLTLAQEVL